DGDPERLEGAGGRMDLQAGRARYGPLNDVRQLGRAGERPALAGLHEPSGDAACPALFAVLTDDPRQLRLRKPVHQLGRREMLLRVHTHVEGAVRAEAEAALRPVELHGGDAEV